MQSTGLHAGATAGGARFRAANDRQALGRHAYQRVGSGAVSRKVWQRGDIVVADFDPTLSHEQQERRPAIVVMQAALNRLGMIGICPITQGGQAARHAGLCVSLTGTGLQTAGIVLVHQFRMIDPTERSLSLSLIEQAPDHLTEEVRARVAALLD